MEYETITLMDGNKKSDRFEYYQSTEEPLTESMKLNVMLAGQCFDDEVALVVLGEDVMMAFIQDESTDFRKIEKEVKEKCNEILSCPPDFEILTVEGKAFLVFMGGSLFSIVPYNTEVEKLSLDKAIDHRQRIINACEKVKIYGVAFHENINEPE